MQQTKIKKILLSDEAWAIKVTMPLICLAFCVWMLIDSSTIHLFLNRSILFAPFFAMAVWAIIVPSEIEVNENESFLTVINWWSSIRVPLRDIDYVARRISVFDTLKIKSGKKILYITCKANKNLLSGSS
jgi:hypothetical protein